MTFNDGADWTRRLGAALLCLCLPIPVGKADDTQAPAPLFPRASDACFAAGVPAGGRLNPLSEITSLIVRPRKPETDGDGDFPPEVEGNQPPEEPGAVPLTLVVAFEGDDGAEPNALRRGARFMCIPGAADGSQLVCNVDDWCSDAGFDLRIESDDRISLDVLPDAGSVGELGNPCSLDRRSLAGSATALVTYRLDRRPESICR